MMISINHPGRCGVARTSYTRERGIHLRATRFRVPRGNFTGWFYNRRLGRFRLFATDLSRGVVLELPHRVLVVTPADPQAFNAFLHQEYPGISLTEDTSGKPYAGTEPG